MFGPFSAPRDPEKPAPKQTAAPLPSWNLGFGSCFGAIHGLNDQNMGKTASSHSTLKRCRSTITSSFGAWRLGSATDEVSSFGLAHGGKDAKHRPLPYLRITPGCSWQIRPDSRNVRLAHKLVWVKAKFYFCVLHDTKFHQNLSTGSLMHILFTLYPQWL